jgi:hypothetical protein
MADKAREYLARQCERAGMTKGYAVPTAVPEHVALAAISAAIADTERGIVEECAKIALDYGDDEECVHANRAVQWNVAMEIATRIRSRGAHKAGGGEP